MPRFGEKTEHYTEKENGIILTGDSPVRMVFHCLRFIQTNYTGFHRNPNPSSHYLPPTAPRHADASMRPCVSEPLCCRRLAATGLRAHVRVSPAAMLSYFNEILQLAQPKR